MTVLPPGQDGTGDTDTGPPQSWRRSGLPVGDLLDTTTRTVDLAVPSRVLAVGAHPDDIEFGAGATLAKWSAAGCRVHFLVLTDGSKGSWDADADLEMLVGTRADECRRAASLIAGTEAGDPTGRVHFLGQVDGELVNDADARREVARVIRSVRPDVVLGHDPWRRYRLHPDHRAAGFLTLDAVVAARDPHFFADLALPPHRPQALLLWEADLPNHVEQVTVEDASAKIDALLCHGSQLESTMRMNEADRDGSAGRATLATRIEWQLAQHGGLAAVDTGEAFRLMDDL